VHACTHVLCRQLTRARRSWARANVPRAPTPAPLWLWATQQRAHEFLGGKTPRMHTHCAGVANSHLHACTRAPGSAWVTHQRAQQLRGCHGPGGVAQRLRKQWFAHGQRRMCICCRWMCTRASRRRCSLCALLSEGRAPRRCAGNARVLGC